MLVLLRVLLVLAFPFQFSEHLFLIKQFGHNIVFFGHEPLAKH